MTRWFHHASSSKGNCRTVGVLHLDRDITGPGNPKCSVVHRNAGWRPARIACASSRSTEAARARGYLRPCRARPQAQRDPEIKLGIPRGPEAGGGDTTAPSYAHEPFATVSSTSSTTPASPGACGPIDPALAPQLLSALQHSESLVLLADAHGEVVWLNDAWRRSPYLAQFEGKPWSRWLTPAGARIEYRQADAFALPFETATFDLVVCQSRMPDGARRVVSVAEVVRVAGGAGARELYAWRDGAGKWRAPLGDALAARLGTAA